jgi:hypothetical protein
MRLKISACYSEFAMLMFIFMLHLKCVPRLLVSVCYLLILKYVESDMSLEDSYPVSVQDEATISENAYGVCSVNYRPRIARHARPDVTTN